MKKILTSLAAAALLVFAAGTADAGQFDAAYDCHFALTNSTSFDSYMVFLSKPDGSAGFADLNIPMSQPQSGGYVGYVFGHLTGNTFTIPGNSTTLTFSGPQNGPMTISGSFNITSLPITLTCTQIF